VRVGRNNPKPLRQETVSSQPAAKSYRVAVSFNAQVFLEFGAGEILGDGLMLGGFACEDEIAASLLDGGGDGLAGEQIVAEKDWPEVGHRRAVPRAPSLRGVAFAILLLGPVLWRDELRRQRQDLLVARCHDAGAQERVEILGAAIGTLPC